MSRIMNLTGLQGLTRSFFLLFFNLLSSQIINQNFLFKIFFCIILIFSTIKKYNRSTTNHVPRI
jgi:hypothetical protein